MMIGLLCALTEELHDSFGFTFARVLSFDNISQVQALRSTDGYSPAHVNYISQQRARSEQGLLYRRYSHSITASIMLSAYFGELCTSYMT